MDYISTGRTLPSWILKIYIFMCDIVNRVNIQFRLCKFFMLVTVSLFLLLLDSWAKFTFYRFFSNTPKEAWLNRPNRSLLILR